jgi:hypothetical protein
VVYICDASTTDSEVGGLLHSWIAFQPGETQQDPISKNMNFPVNPNKLRELKKKRINQEIPPCSFETLRGSIMYNLD